MSSPNKRICGVVLAGGKGRRLGGVDKGLLRSQGKPFIAYILELLAPQVGDVLINANRNISEYQKHGKVIQDNLEDYQGPLAGMQTAMANTDKAWILTVPCDSIHIPADLASRLYENADTHQSRISVAHDGQRLQPVHALIHCSLAGSLTDYLSGGERKIDRWYAKHDFVHTDFSDYADSFLNVNTPEDKKDLGAE